MKHATGGGLPGPAEAEAGPRPTGGAPGAPVVGAQSPRKGGAGPEAGPPQTPSPRPGDGASRPDEGADGPSAQPAAADAPPAWSGASLVVLTGVAVLLLGAVLAHLVLVFLSIGPANAATNAYQRQINAYIYPEFGQDWKLFAPNPLQQNVAVGARLQTAGPGGTLRTGDWTDLTAQDIAAIRHNPLPSHADQNMLRRAFDAYLNSHDQQERNTDGFRGDLAVEYLKRIALQRLGRTAHGERVVAVQFASRTNLVRPPSWTREKQTQTTAYRTLPWWPVNDRDYWGL
ncbi:DUF5819 family protein [Streptomyces sp. NPDC001380]|uniref:DUF5819 family protein n=1 Tax=Streptomyces sp. NPDC001380 TaxID=3364566 RepID=UPI00368EAA68